ncbi:nuclear hormone receptor HR96 isoform X1 [Neodiprion fabricii]|uniref:nuclear hormone receptor HR96 isoform X1 n=1 Tax=Neodiprion fabricii TaxID=2872261 RepID=UPI001ED96FC0|nr:nuclear hormone receptor HR96 isoform X1 [Neodiprion fabricii]
MEDEANGREANKTCGVCGDRALGYNFNAVSCESCKAFFRRNALKNKDFRCPFTENCTITVVTRRFCQKCRLDKCFTIGMRKEYIMTEEAKVLKRQKIEQNRAKKRPQHETTKTPKLKRENVEENSFDQESSSLPFGPPETYIWESDRKYTDLDGNRQQVTDSMSPVTAASVPSPSSPPEGGNVTGSKTLDMLRDQGTVRYEQNPPRFEQGQGTFEKVIQGRGKYVGNTPPPSVESYESSAGFETSSQKFLKLDESVMSLQGNMEPEVSRYKSNLASLEVRCATPSGSSKYGEMSRFDGSRFGQLHSSNDFGQKSSTIDPDSGMHGSGAKITEIPETACRKPKETCPKESDLVSKVMQEPRLIARILSNPEFAAKIFQDQGFISKIITDTDTVSRLVSDPQISKFLEESDVGSTDEITAGSQSNVKPRTDFGENLANNGITDNMIRHMLDAEQKEVENPILTNLITNRNSAECKNANGEPSASGDWSKAEDVARDILQDVQRIPITVNSIESILCEAIKLEFSACSTLGGNRNSRELNDAERAKLNELIVANKALLAPLDDDITNLVGEDCRFKGNAGQSDPMLLDVINLTAIAIRRLIKMSKKINAFKNMCQEDQLALLKGGCTEMMILRSAINYDPDKDMWKIPHSQERMSKIKVDVLKEAKGNLYAEHSRFVRTFDPKWRDENIILILSAIALFTPDRPRVIHSDVIKLEQNSYYYLLRRYLESVYPGCEAKSTFLQLIQKISELHRLNDEVVGVYLNVNPSSVEPLLIEIFDLKH